MTVSCPRCDAALSGYGHVPGLPSALYWECLSCMLPIVLWRDTDGTIRAEEMKPPVRGGLT